MCFTFTKNKKRAKKPLNRFFQDGESDGIRSLQISIVVKLCQKLQLHNAIYRLRFYSNSLIHILSLSNSHNNVASIQKNRGDKSHRVIVAKAMEWTLALCSSEHTCARESTFFILQRNSNF